MAIVTKEILEKADHAFEVKPGDPCFRCGEPLRIPYVMWAGCGEKDGQKLKGKPTGQIALHASCARLLAANLVDDADKSEARPRALC